MLRYLIEANKYHYESNEVKEIIIDKLLKDGYGTYAKRFKDYKFIIAHAYKGIPISVAAMLPDDGVIVLNPSLLDLTAITSQKDINTHKTESELQEKLLDQLCVLIRHELLHFLLVHEKRFKKHLEETDPNFEQNYKSASINRLANFAMDYDISNKGYDEHDKQVVRLMTLNGEIVGGLITEDDHPEWVTKSVDKLEYEVNLSMEEMYDRLKEIVDQQQKENKDKPLVIRIKKASHSQEYRDMYNKIIQKFDGLTEAEIQAAITDLMSGKDII